jgi:hypothetical protein
MNDHSSIEGQVNQSLDDSVENLSPEVRMRLNRNRMRALEAKKDSTWHFSGLQKLAVGVSFLFVVSFGWLFFSQTHEEIITPFAAVLDEDLEMLDDLEFVYWLAEESEIALL